MQIIEHTSVLFSFTISNELMDLLRQYFELYKKAAIRDKVKVLSINLLQFDFFDVEEGSNEVMVGTPLAVALSVLYVFYSTYPPGDNFDMDFSELNDACEKVYTNTLKASINGEEGINGSDYPLSWQMKKTTEAHFKILKNQSYGI